MKFSSRLYILGCDLRLDTGEGFLANSIISELKSSHDVLVYEDPIIHFLRMSNFARDRIQPIYIFFVGLLLLVRKKKVVVVNYIPIWNFLNSLLVRFGAQIGPVTGSVGIVPKESNFFDKFCREYLQVTLIHFFLKLCPREIFLWAATPSVMCQFQEYKFRNLAFAFPFASYIEELEVSDKKFDIFIYSSNHPIKNHPAMLRALDILRADNYSICYVGPSLERSYEGVTCYSNLSESEFNRHLASSKLYISFSNEDAGITGMKALAYGLPVLCPLQSGLSFMTSFDQSYTYNDPYDSLEIANKANYLLGKASFFRDKSKRYFFKLRADSMRVLSKWSKAL